MIEINQIYNDDCMNVLPEIQDNSFNLTLTDIPYDGCSMEDSGLRTISKGAADVITFNITEFIAQLYRITKGTIIVFCGPNQISEIYNFFKDKQLEHKGTVRQLIWNKINPSPMNGKYIYLSGIENAIWFKKSSAAFNANCKNTVFSYPIGSGIVHPTEKNHMLLRELILDNSNEDDIVFDPCCGSGSHLLVAKLLNRKYVGVELNKEWYLIAKNRLDYCDSSNISMFTQKVNKSVTHKSLF